jgi:hypothetical protein
VIRPGKHLNLQNCVLRVAAALLHQLQRTRVERLTALLNLVRESFGHDAMHHFLPALDFLFLLGCVDYLPASDTIEYLSPSHKELRNEA